MSYEHKPGSGTIFKNDRKEKEIHPDYKGTIVTLDGVECWVSLWVKRPDGKPPFFSVSLQPKQQKQPEVVDAVVTHNDLPF